MIKHFIVALTFALLHEVSTSRSTEGEGVNGFIKEPPCPEWESLMFWITNGIGNLGKACEKHSDYYCLDAYQTQNTFGERNLSALEKSDMFFYDPTACSLWFSTLIHPEWEKINMIDYNRPYSCCENQVQKYMVYGLLHKTMNPDEYMNKLTDYEDENKTLNYITAYYMPHVCQNLILEVGFGPGKLRRNHHTSVEEGAPYVIAGRELGGIGIPHIPSKEFDYKDPGKELTFHWFKHNIMCKAQPWICRSKRKTAKKGNHLASGRGAIRPDRNVYGKFPKRDFKDFENLRFGGNILAPRLRPW